MIHPFQAVDNKQISLKIVNTAITIDGRVSEPHKTTTDYKTGDCTCVRDAAVLLL